jgi:hypothetical protein
VGFDGIRYDSFLGDLHETIEEDKGKELIFEGFISFSCKCKGCRSEYFARDFLFERGPCWEGVFQN